MNGCFSLCSTKSAKTLMMSSSSGEDGAKSDCMKNLRSHVVIPDPSMWGDTFKSYSVDEQLQAKYAKDIEILKEETKELLISEGRNKIEKLTLIDTLERLGVAYHFDREIEEQLQLIFEHHYANSANDDLFSVALEFCLLRQHCYHVSCGVFDKFKGKDNKFDEDISCNAEGLLSVYEAAQARIHGEEILDEVVDFATQNLNLMLPQLESPLREKVKRALEQSLHRGVPIVEVRNYINIYEKDETHNKLLLKFAKLNFNFLQNMYKKELYEVSRWWDQYDIRSKLEVPYIRDRLVECYFWGIALHFEPQYAFVRTATAKSMQIFSVVDDTYDNYATIEEGELFTEVLERWDINESVQLPDYMKIVYKLVLSAYEEFGRQASEKRKSYMNTDMIEAVKDIGKAYLKELKWFNGRQLPSFEEYFANTIATSGMYVMFLPCFIGMESVSKETIEWFVSVPKLAFATSRMGRHMDNVGSCEWESREGQMPTAVDCYMKQHGLSKEETLANFIQQANDSWKQLNAEMGKVPSSIPKDIVQVFLNYARGAEITYKKCEDGYTHPEKFLAPQIASVLIDHIPL